MKILSNYDTLQYPISSETTDKHTSVVYLLNILKCIIFNMIYIILCLVACLLTWLCWRWLRVRRYWAERGVPHLPPNPFLGSLTFLQKQNVGVWMRRMSEHFRTPYIGIWLFWRPALVVNCPDIARRVLVKDAASFRNRLVGCGDTDPIGKLNLFTIKDPEWTNLRRRLTSTFTAAKLRILQDFISSKSKELVQRIQREQQSGISLKSLYVDYTTDVIGTSAFGVGCNATLTGTDPLRAVAEGFMTYSPIRGLGSCSVFFFPEMTDFFRFKFFPKSATDYFRKIFKAAATLRDNVASARETRDLLDALLKLRKNESDEGYSEDTIIAQAAIFLFGGFDTTGSLLAFITYELAFHLDVQEKLYKELLGANINNARDDFTSEQLAEMTYLNCVIKEVLRKHTSMGWLDRVATIDYQIDDNLTIKAGTPVYVNTMGMHYNPDYYYDPKKFDPDRFLPENDKDRKPYTFMPFGEGPRACIGQRFGLMTARYAISSVVLNYQLQPFPNAPRPEDVVIDKRGAFYTPGEPICVQFLPRT
ncbi:cytochrome P450 6k1-like [Bicyclus anynana]|uniref:unspecific monooxygenase n=1 Tax=Bicyclus anynana TaxID=110368 RepID=A0A6J1MV35_BICAN|nr:cytochrome P450 6k1-like [Bicyclus anynana]